MPQNIILSCVVSGAIILLIRNDNYAKDQTITSAITFFIFLGVGLYTSQLNKTVTASNYFLNTPSKFYLVKSTNPPIEKPNSFQIHATILQSEHANTQGKALIYIEKSKNAKSISYGDILVVKNKFKPIKANGNPFEFDYKRYLRIHNINHQAYLKEKDWKLHKKAAIDLFGYIFLLRQTCDHWLESSSLSTQNKKVAKALLLGEKEFLDEATLKSFSSAGAMHVLAVSGLHVGIIMLILQFILKPIKRLKYGEFVHAIIVIFGVWFYALLTGFSPSVIRAALMFSFIVIGMGLQRQNSIYQSILVSAFIILIFDPFSLFKVGFQLSYLAVLGIVYFQPKIYRAFYFSSTIIDYIWQITSVSIAAQLATFPLGLYYFHQFPNLFFISNIIVIPLAGIILMLGFVYFILHFAQPLSYILEQVIDFCLTFLHKSVTLIENLPFAIIWGISIHWVEVFLIYFLILSFAFAFVRKSKALFFSFLGIGCLLLVFKGLEQQNNFEQRHFVCYNIKNDFALDVFQGPDNTFISTPALLTNESKLLFHVKHFWYHKRGSKSPYRIINIENLKNPIIKLSTNETVCIINKSANQYPLSNYIILYKVDYIDKKVLNAWKSHSARLILHADLHWKLKNYCQMNYPKELLFNQSEKGAFELSYK
ncbi:MAG: ComEC/Rec2 family competence protein [Putridiphycobacter sp.]|nr:ComEC/Rec2 family competence protein [Putridiphycobacter sp.]